MIAADNEILGDLLAEIFDRPWYQRRYSDVIAAKIDPLQHFLLHGLREFRDPNPFFDSIWYSSHYPDVGLGGIVPILHYLQAGGAELRNPNPRFDAAWYVDQHPESAANPLLYHIRFGRALGYTTERIIAISDYLPVSRPPVVKHQTLRVDVVIPVFSGFDETQRCLESVIANTERPLGRIIVVEDKSPEPGLVKWLDHIAGQGEIHLVHNKRNLGFVRSVNVGMQISHENDIVLLNSDTEVPPGWLQRLAYHAYAEPRIASVSPFSNNATICSWPCNDGGPMPFGLDVQTIDTACREVNSGRSVDVPTTVGYCMYIRREALNEIGLFDADRFKMGYGEENDFCLRATARGWHHRLACDTFVYHKGSVSFQDRTITLSKRAAELIEERFPTYPQDVAKHVALGMADPARFALTAAIFRRMNRPVILLISHNLGGGIQRHIDELMNCLKDRANFLLLSASDRGTELSVPSLPGHPRLVLSAAQTDALLQVLGTMAVTRVHIHHVLGIDIDIKRLIHSLGLSFDFTVHDYYGICPQINLLPWRHGVYCGEPETAACNACIAHRSTNHAVDIVSWRTDHAWLFRQADRVLCPSKDVINRLRRHDLAERAVYAPHEPVAPGSWPLSIKAPTAGERLRVAVIGTLVDHKGARTVAAVAGLAGSRGIDVHLIGHIDGEFRSAALPHMKITGRYQEHELDHLISVVAPHVVWFPMSWPEPYSYTLSAALAAGLPIAAPDLGAFPERLSGRPSTWLMPVGTSPAGWIELFETIKKSLCEPSKSTARTEIQDYYQAHYLDSRQKKIAKLPTTKRPQLAILPERFDNGTPTPCAYIRLIQPLSHPTITGDFDIILADQNSIVDLKPDIIITQRFALGDVATATRVSTHARAIGARLIYDLDDDLINLPRSHPDAAVLRPLAKVVRYMLDIADVVWVSTSHLANSLASLRPDARVMENRLDERLWAYAPHALPSRQNPIRILAMGTATHDRDFALIVPALTRLKREYQDRLVIEVLGMTSQSSLPEGVSRIGAPTSALRSYPSFVQWLTTAQPSWHIGLAPLLDTNFNASKSAIKAMDYSALGLAVLASDTSVYRGSLADGTTGCLVPNTPADWYDALDRMVRDAETRLNFMQAAQPAFLARASLKSYADIRRQTCMNALKDVVLSPISTT